MSTSMAEPSAVRVWFDTMRMFVALTDGRELSVPLGGFPRLMHATAEQRMRVELSGRGLGLHWPELDEDISVPGLVAGFTDNTRMAKEHLTTCPDCAIGGGTSPIVYGMQKTRAQGTDPKSTEPVKAAAASAHAQVQKKK